MTLKQIYNEALDAPLTPPPMDVDGDPYDAFIGRKRDDIITRYGAPNRSARLDNGLTIMEYRTSTRYRIDGRKTSRSICTLRLWHKGKSDGSTIVKAGQMGDTDACAAFILTGIRNSVQCKGFFCVLPIEAE